VAAEARLRRPALVAGALLALAAVVLTAMVVSSGEQVDWDQGRDRQDGARLRAVLVVRAEHALTAEVTATVRLTNAGDRPAWFRGSPCAGPGAPVARPEGASPGTPGPDAGAAVRERLIRAGEATAVVTLVPADDEPCDPGERRVRVDPGATLSWTHRSPGPVVDRSSAARATLVVQELDRAGRPAGRLRLVVPLAELPGSVGATIDQVVDAFLAEPRVVELLDVAGDDVLTVVRREGASWRLSLGSASGDVSAEVGPDLSVTDVRAGT
jgi:hypothetical protein